MTFEDYLISLLGKEKAEKLYDAIDANITLVISGVNGSGKTTLANILRKRGCKVIEDHEIYNIELEKVIEHQVKNMESNVF